MPSFEKNQKYDFVFRELCQSNGKWYLLLEYEGKNTLPSYDIIYNWFFRVPARDSQKSWGEAERGTKVTCVVQGFNTDNYGNETKFPILKQDISTLLHQNYSIGEEAPFTVIRLPGDVKENGGICRGYWLKDEWSLEHYLPFRELELTMGEQVILQVVGIKDDRLVFANPLPQKFKELFQKGETYRFTIDSEEVDPCTNRHYFVCHDQIVGYTHRFYFTPSSLYDELLEIDLRVDDFLPKGWLKLSDPNAAVPPEEIAALEAVESDAIPREDNQREFKSSFVRTADGQLNRIVTSEEKKVTDVKLSLEECENAIGTLQALGIPVPADLLEQLNELKKTPDRFTIYGELKKGVSFSAELDQCVQETIQKLTKPEPGKEHDPGLLLGKIQSGKTRAFEGIIADAFDKGVDVVIVLTKGTRALATQTIARLKRDFAFCLGRTVYGRPVIEISNILSKRNGFTTRELSDKNIIVCKKQKENLKILARISQIGGFADKKILIIDDEADFASRNFREREGNVELATISGQIDDLCTKCLKYCYYLQVTATPYSLFLQPSQEINLDTDGAIMSFKPRFTSILPIYDGYVGGDEYFEYSKDGNSMYSYLHALVSEDCQHALVTKDERILNNATSTPKLCELRKAIMGYFVASAIRSIQQRTKDKNVFLSSCIVHIDIAQRQHKEMLIN